MKELLTAYFIVLLQSVKIDHLLGLRTRESFGERLKLLYDFIRSRQILDLKSIYTKLGIDPIEIDGLMLKLGAEYFKIGWNPPPHVVR